MEEHKCKGCKYFFIGEMEVEKRIYNALSDRYVSFFIKKKVPGCGYSNISMILDNNHPRCTDFEEE
jgi:glutaredoxin-related protein